MEQIIVHIKYYLVQITVYIKIKFSFCALNAYIVKILKFLKFSACKTTYTYFFNK